MSLNKVSYIDIHNVGAEGPLLLVGSGRVRDFEEGDIESDMSTLKTGKYEVAIGGSRPTRLGKNCYYTICKTVMYKGVFV